MTKELKDTISLMLSDDFKVRGVAEYLQIKIRTEQNRTFIKNWKRGELKFSPCNTLEQSETQLKAMELYEFTLRNRLKQVFNISDDDDFEELVWDIYHKNCDKVRISDN